MDSITRKLTVLVVLVLFSAYFSATETAFSSVNRIKLKNDAQSGDKRAKKALDLCDKYDKLLSTILIGNNIVNILASSIATALFVLYFPTNGVTVSTTVMTLLILTFGEITPKTMAKEMPESFAKFSAPIISMLLIILTPLNYLFSFVQHGITKIFKISSNDAITNRELLTMVEEAQSDGGINEDEGNLLISAIEFYDLEVSDILTPRVDVIAIDIEDTAADIKSTFRKSGYSRLPVFRDTIDNIVGIINEKDFHYCKNIKDIICPAVFVPENMKISKLTALLREKKSHLAIVTDEYGGTVGVVSLEDALEELVGEIWDEHDLVREEFIRLSPNRWRISGNAHLDRMFEILEFTPPEEAESNSVSGWITEILGYIPKKGERFEYGPLLVLVTKTEQNRIVEAMVTKKADSDRNVE